MASTAVIWIGKLSDIALICGLALVSRPSTICAANSTASSGAAISSAPTKNVLRAWVRVEAAAAGATDWVAENDARKPRVRITWPLLANSSAIAIISYKAEVGVLWLSDR